MKPGDATTGTRLSELDTPALLLDLDTVERNLARMASFLSAKGVKPKS